MKNSGELLRYWRKRRRLTLEELGRELGGLNKATISTWETGKKTIDPKYHENICRILNVDVNEIFQEIHKPHKIYGDNMQISIDKEIEMEAISRQLRNYKIQKNKLDNGNYIKEIDISHSSGANGELCCIDIHDESGIYMEITIPGNIDAKNLSFRNISQVIFNICKILNDKIAEINKETGI